MHAKNFIDEKCVDAKKNFAIRHYIILIFLHFLSKLVYINLLYTDKCFIFAFCYDFYVDLLEYFRFVKFMYEMLRIFFKVEICED